MASIGRSFRLFQFWPLRQSRNVPVLSVSILTRLTDNHWRQYSQYPPSYVEPIYRKENLKDVIKSGEAKELAFVPVKAALNSQTSSVLHDPLVTKFTNYVMKAGNKPLARDLIEKTFETIKRIQLQKYHQAETEEEKANIECNPVTIMHNAVENTRPILQLTPIKRGGVKYQVPVPITEKHSYFIAMRWLVEAGREKERKVHFPEKLAKELIDASRNEGRVVKKKQDLHRQCEANRAYAHYRWS